FLVPAGTSNGAATLSIFNGGMVRSTAKVQIESVAPALFTQNRNGKGVPSAAITRIAANGEATFAPVYDCPAGGTCVPAPIDMGSPDDTIYLTLYGTGIRHRSTLTAVGVTVDGLNTRVDYAGPQNQYEGMDQV